MKKKCCISDYSKLFKALGDSNRLNIFNYIFSCNLEGKEAANVKEVSNCCDVDMSVVSRHLSTLKESGALNATKQGKEVHYSVNSKELAKQLRELADFLDPQTK